eukprot:TRINITY_DN12765_c0_g1_i1.p1 TRINITY_DN12765_c0_g1~~TRINITY_DN12765_c0_g1_i1.p1  ORF type:complete len:198 (+),score=23.79 TRINITY_DN12765_c0_g1_i1:78-671(+)
MAQDLKVVMVGDISVGKTSIVTRFTSNKFSENVSQTIGASCLFRELDVEGTPVKFSVWDTAGQEIYHSMVPVYFRQAAGVILTYDVSNKSTLQAVHKWIEQIKGHAPPEVVVALVGNKSDLLEGEDDGDEARDIAMMIDGFSTLVSAKTGDNVVELFEEIYRQYLLKNPDKQPASKSTVKLPAGDGSKPDGGKSCSC